MATKANISIDQGSTFSTTINLTDDSGNPLDLSAYSAQAQMRTSYASVNAITFSTTLANGVVSLSLNAATTSTLTRSRYLYDVQLIDSSNNVTRVLEGTVYVDPAITHANTTNTYYTMYLSTVQQTFFPGDTVYQSNGSANITATVYYVSDPLLGYGSAGTWAGGGTLNTNTSNVVIVKVMNPTGVFAPTGNTTYLLYSSNALANGVVTNVTSTVAE